MEPAVETRSGILFDLLNPQPEMVVMSDIAEQLAKLCRFNGATQIFYSVAQHSLLVADHVPQNARPYALLHDAHEAYLGDWTNPLKQALFVANNQHCGIMSNPLQKLENLTAQAIHQAAGLQWPVPMSIKASIKDADMATLATERDILMPKAGNHWPSLKGIAPLPVNIKPMSWPDAADKFYTALADAHLVRGSEHSAQGIAI